MKHNHRAGFTLIEMMVAMALTLFVMVILSQAFVLSLETFSRMKGIGDMQTNLRVATTLLRDDLAQDGFEGKRRLSDPNIATQPPQAGFVAILQRSNLMLANAAPPSPVPLNPMTWPSYYYHEGNDTSGMPSYRASDHVLYMTVKRKGNRRENFFTAALADPAGTAITPFFNAQTAYNVPSGNLSQATLSQGLVTPKSGFYSSQWAEVAYYLKRQGSTEEQNNPLSNIAGSTPTFELFRAEFVMVPDGTNVSNKFNKALALENSTFKGMSCNPGAAQLTFYSPADAARGNRLIPTLANFNPATLTTTSRVSLGETAVLPNVISFQIQVMPAGSPAFVDLTPPNNLYDTAKFNTAGYNNNFGLKAIQITLRVFDHGTRQTRQVTIVQDM